MTEYAMSSTNSSSSQTPPRPWTATEKDQIKAQLLTFQSEGAANEKWGFNKAHQKAWYIFSNRQAANRLYEKLDKTDAMTLSKTYNDVTAQYMIMCEKINISKLSVQPPATITYTTNTHLLFNQSNDSKHIVLDDRYVAPPQVNTQQPTSFFERLMSPPHPKEVLRRSIESMHSLMTSPSALMNILKRPLVNSDLVQAKKLISPYLKKATEALNLLEMDVNGDYGLSDGELLTAMRNYANAVDAVNNYYVDMATVAIKDPVLLAKIKSLILGDRQEDLEHLNAKRPGAGV
ncbi:MAG: hypothetical protein CK424_05225 [Legionella sp.]|nr:MAG: hypothetical protein CK424_05225 [Legionella sp.]